MYHTGNPMAMDPERWKRVEQLYHSAAARDPEGRQAFIVEACEGDTSLQEEVESLLAQTLCTTELMGDVIGSLAKVSLTDPGLCTLVLGQQLGPYRIESILGTGGMGEVYRARDTRLGRTVAIKLLRGGSFLDAMSRIRFQREARAASALNHVNVCTVYDVGEWDGQPYLVMEYLEGETLRERLRRGPLPLTELIDLGIQIADALDAAHSRGILHRDIKDTNVFVTNHRDAKVLDFGIAKVMERAVIPAAAREDVPTTSLAPVTETGALIGTVAYMSPEQARGEKLDPRSDLFSLGVLLYEMATGTLPFQGNTPAMIFDAILNAKPLPVRHLRPELARKLEEVIHPALEKNRERRVQSAAELRTALQHVRRELELRPSLPAVRRASRGPKVLLLLTALGLAALAGWATAHAWLPIVFEPKIRSLAVLPLQNASGDVQQEYFAEGMTEALINDLSKISALQVIRVPRKPARQIARELGVDAIVDGSVTRSGEQVRFSANVIQAATDRPLWAKNYERNLRDILILQNEVAREVASEIKVRVTPQEKAAFANAGTVNSKAYEAYLRGRQFFNRQTESSYRKAIEEFRLSIEESPNYAPAYAGLADSYSNISWWFVPPLDVLDVAKAAATKAVRIDPTLAEGHVSLALITGFVEWDWSAAERELKTAVALNPGFADAHHWYAHWLEAVGRINDGLSELKRAHELDPLSPIFDKDLALAYFYSRDYGQALAQVRKILEVEPGFWRGHMTIGQVYLQKKMFSEAITEFKQASVISGSNALPSAGLAHAYASYGQGVEARRILKELEDRSKTSYVLPEAIAEIYLSLGENDLALRWLERAYVYHAPRFAWLVKRDPNYDHLRSDPRFKRLLAEMRLPQ
jgi:serine/threonine protein kinase/Flp pilus assembly protein TadD